MCYEKKLFKYLAPEQPKLFPPEKMAEGLSKLIHNTNHVKELFLQSTETPFFDTVLLPGEQQSIKEIIKNLEAREASMKETQKQFL